MSRTFSGILFYDAANLNLPTALTGGATAGNYNLVRNATGDVSLNNNAGAATVQFWFGVADVKRPFFNFNYPPAFGTVPSSNELNEAFGTAAGGPGNPLGPGFQQTAAIPWGLALVDIFAIYSVQTAALTSATLGCSRVSYVENTANTITALIAATGIALTTTGAAGSPHVSVVSATTPLVFESINNSDLLVELTIQAAATSAVRVYGMGCHVAVEYS